jgi:hypothetical protein
LTPTPGNAVVMASVTVQGQIFIGRVRGGKLKTWETGNLTSSLITQLARISGFQNFSFSLAPRCTVPGPGRGGVRTATIGQSRRSQYTENIADAGIMIGNRRQNQTFKTYHLNDYS